LEEETGYYMAPRKKKLQKRQIGKRTAASEVWSWSPNARNAAVWFPENAPNEEVN
jgi:hypothetical protein